MQRIPDHR